MSEVGYVRIHRALIGHPAFRNDAEAMAFAWMVARAAWRPARVRYKGHPINLLRGQLALSIRDFATSMDRDKAWVERLMKRLKSEAMIETALETGVSVITICNYDVFQGNDKTGETAGEAPPETEARQRRDTEQEENERKKEKKKDAGAIPEIPDWLPAIEWQGFRDMRTKAGKTLTDRGASLIVGKLGKLRAAGHDPAAVLDQSTEHNWLTVYEMKGGQQATRRNGKPVLPIA